MSRLEVFLGDADGSSKVVAIVMGALSILLAVGYLLLVQILDFRGEVIPAPVSFLGFWMY